MMDSNDNNVQPEVKVWREFWVIPESKIGNGGCFFTPSDTTIHVIEVEALNELKAERDNYAKIANEANDNLAASEALNDKLTEEAKQLKVANHQLTEQLQRLRYQQEPMSNNLKAFVKDNLDLVAANEKLAEDNKRLTEKHDLVSKAFNERGDYLDMLNEKLRVAVDAIKTLKKIATNIDSFEVAKEALAKLESDK